MNIKNLISLVLAAAMFPAASIASAEEALLGLTPANRTASMVPGSVAETPEEYIFEYDGQEFILLDKEEKNGKSYFFVITEDIYGTHKYDASSRSNTECLAYWEPEDEYNMAYWLNNEFWENGNEGKALPDMIKEYIDKEHVWHTEPLKNLEGYQAEKLTPLPLALLANYEWKAYIDKIGQNVADGWFFRTARTGDVADSTNILCSGKNNPLGTTGAWRSNGTALGIRPVFYLDSDFFANVKLDKIGEGILKELDGYCNPEFYTEEELDELFPIPSASMVEVSGDVVVGEKLTVDYMYEGLFEEGESEFKWYQADEENGEYTIIEGEGSQELLLGADLEGKYIKAAVLPRSISKMNPMGEEVISEIPVGFIFGDTQINEAVNAVLNAEPEDILAELQKTNIVFKLDLDLYSLEPESRENAMVIFSKMEFATVEELRASYNSAVALASLNELKDISLMESMLRNTELGLDLTRFDKVNDKRDIVEAVFGKKFEDFKTFENIFYHAVAAAEVSQSDRDEIKEVLLAHNELFSTDLSKLTDYQLGLAGVSILKNTYKDFEELDKAVAKAYKEALDEKEEIEPPKRPSSGGGGGGSNGGSSGSGNKGTTPIISYHDTQIPALGGDEEKEPPKNETEEEETIEFNDLQDAEWAKESILALAQKGILSGDGDGSFRPNAELTREEFVKMVVCAFCPDEEADEMTSFTDTKAGAWYMPYIDVAYKNNLVMGISETEFGIGTNLTREDMTVILYRALENKKDVSLSMFNDSEQISPYALEAVLYMAGAGIISGVEENMFMPKLNATRAMAAQVLYKTMQFAEKL